MTDIFISYARENLNSVKPLAEALLNSGLTVFWDTNVPTGSTWQKYIGDALQKAKCVVVVWTVASVKSEWVLEEAAEGKNKGNLFPVKLENVDLPFGYRAIQALDLSNWNKTIDSPIFKQLLQDMGHLLDFPLTLKDQKESILTPNEVKPHNLPEVNAQQDPLLPELVEIPAGSFGMGSKDGEKDERPLHSVHIRKPFKLGRYVVTFEQYDAYAAAKGISKPDDEGWGRRNRPVINVSWDDIQNYIEWLNEQTNGGYRMPTEAEWEYACRAETSTNYSWGDEFGDNNAKCVDSGSQRSEKQTAPVGSFEPNAFGLYDMHGNVWEWVQDCYARNYNNAPKGGSSYEVDNCKSRVLRGGSWRGDPRNLRSANRADLEPSTRGYNIGFRLARDL